MEKSKKRNIYIDIMKGLLITLVVIGHLPYFEYDSRTLVLIYSFHMHAFLIIGGMLSHIDANTRFSTIIYKRVTGTLVPYFIFYLVTFLIVPTTAEQKLNAFPVVIKGIGIPPDHALNLPLWFLTFYFVAMTVFELLQFIGIKGTGVIIAIKGTLFKTKNFLKLNTPFRNLHRTNKTKKQGIPTAEVNNTKEQMVPATTSNILLPMTITFVFVAIIMRISFVYARIYKLPRLPYNIEVAGFCIGFVFIGNTIRRIKGTGVIIAIKGTLFKTKNFLKFIIAIVVTFAIIMITKTWYEYSMWNGRIDLNARDYKNAFYMYVDAILGFILFAIFAYAIFIVATFAKKRLDTLNNDAFDDSLLQGAFNFIYILLGLPAKIISYLGRNSLYILAYHVPSVYYTNRFVIPYLPISIRETLSHNSLISILIMSFLGIAFSLLMSLIHKAIKKNKREE